MKDYIEVLAIAGVVCFLILSLVVRDVYIDTLAAEMVENGAKPVEVRCLLDMGVNNDMICNRLVP